MSVFDNLIRCTPFLQRLIIKSDTKAIKAYGYFRRPARPPSTNWIWKCTTWYTGSFLCWYKIWILNSQLSSNFSFIKKPLTDIYFFGIQLLLSKHLTLTVCFWYLNQMLALPSKVGYSIWFKCMQSMLVFSETRMVRGQLSVKRKRRKSGLRSSSCVVMPFPIKMKIPCLDPSAFSIFLALGFAAIMATPQLFPPPAWLSYKKVVSNFIAIENHRHLNITAGSLVKLGFTSSTLKRLNVKIVQSLLKCSGCFLHKTEVCSESNLHSSMDH